jgi:hypothetical protein
MLVGVVVADAGGMHARHLRRVHSEKVDIAMVTNTNWQRSGDLEAGGHGHWHASCCRRRVHRAAAQHQLRASSNLSSSSTSAGIMSDQCQSFTVLVFMSVLITMLEVKPAHRDWCSTSTGQSGGRNKRPRVMDKYLWFSTYCI